MNKQKASYNTIAGFAIAVWFICFFTLSGEILRRREATPVPSPAIEPAPALLCAPPTPAIPANEDPLEPLEPLEPLKPEITRVFHSHNKVLEDIVNKAIQTARDPALVAAVISVESSGNAAAISSAGTRGLMQLMPSTAKEMAGTLGMDYYDGIEFDPAWNVTVGSKYLEYLVETFRSIPTGLVAYHRGMGNTNAILRKYGHIPASVLAIYANRVLARVE